MKRAALVPLLALAGCAVGGGGSVVGAWRPKRVVESTACIADDAGHCTREVEIGTEQPARRFSGSTFAFCTTGYGQARTAGAEVEHIFLLDASFEYVRGRGPFALGGRAGLTLLDGERHSWIATPLTILAHAGGAWGSVFAGVGYSPLLSEHLTGTPGRTLHDGVEALAGTRLVLRENLGRFITVSPELRYQLVGDIHIVALTANFGVHL